VIRAGVVLIRKHELSEGMARLLGLTFCTRCATWMRDGVCECPRPRPPLAYAAKRIDGRWTAIGSAV
jgi:hypothetical protein